MDFSGVRAVAVDETACRRGHDYITLFADLDRSRLLYATPGRDASVVHRFREDLEARGGRAEEIRDLCMDMSAAYMKGAREAFPEAGITFDRFHVQRSHWPPPRCVLGPPLSSCSRNRAGR